MSIDYLRPQRDLCSTGIEPNYSLIFVGVDVFVIDAGSFLDERCRIDSSERLKAKLPGLVEKLKDPVHFKEFYRYIFMFAKDSEQKCMPVDVWIASRGFVTQRGPPMHRFGMI